MAFYALNMLSMALELAKHNAVYEDMASKFFEVSYFPNVHRWHTYVCSL